MNSRPPWEITAAVAEAEPPAGGRAGRRLAVAMLLTAAALDLTRCGLVLAVARDLVSAAGLVTASVPQAAASGFRNPYAVPDTATAAVGILLAITILATAGRLGRRDTTENPCVMDRANAVTREAQQTRGGAGTRPFGEHSPRTKRDSR